MPADAGPTLATGDEMDARIAIFRELLNQLGGRGGGRYLDLATGHGKFALTARSLGWDVTAVDVRTQRWPEDRNIRWIESDVREFEIEPGFDCIGILGLLYHLELDDQLALLRRCSPAPLILDTHIATTAKVEMDGYRGAIFDEGDLSAPTASWGNPTSFWPTRESLYEMLHDAGYTSIYERTPFYGEDRTFWLCLSESYAPAREALVAEYTETRRRLERRAAAADAAAAAEAASAAAARRASPSPRSLVTRIRSKAARLLQPDGANG